MKEILARTQNGSVKTRTVYQIHPDNAGAVIERMAYDPFGKRRYTSGAYDPNGTLRSASTDRGFTGHEHLDDLGFIHMNGRIFDPTLGRFLSADPFIQYADNIQSYNRYSYLFNNPLNATDPTGYRSLRSFLAPSASRLNGLRKDIDDLSMRITMGYRKIDPFTSYIDKTMMRSEKLRMVGQIVAVVMDGVFCGGACSVIYAGYLTAIAGGSPSDVMKGMAVSYASQAFFNAAGDFTSGMSGLAKIGAHAVAGCASASLGGGNCVEGALSAAVAKGVTVGLEAYYNGKGIAKIPFEVGFPAAVISGGITSQLGGGKFANGAVTGAFGYVFNYCSQNRCFDSPFNAAVVEKHYRGGSGADISVNVSEIDGLLNNPLVTWTKDGSREGVYSIATFGRDGFGEDSQGRALGQLTVVHQKTGGFKFYYDSYDFNPHENPTNNWSVHARNLATNFGGWLVGPGKSFNIIINGTWMPKNSPRSVGNK